MTNRELFKEIIINSAIDVKDLNEQERRDILINLRELGFCVIDGDDEEDINPGYFYNYKNVFYSDKFIREDGKRNIWTTSETEHIGEQDRKSFALNYNTYVELASILDNDNEASDLSRVIQIIKDSKI